MTLDFIGIGFSLFILAIYFASFFFLFKIKVRLSDKFSETIIYFRIAIILLIVLRVQTLLTKAGLLAVPYLQEIFALILSLFLLAAFYSFYNEIYNPSRMRKKR